MYSKVLIATQMNKIQELKQQQLIFIVKKNNGNFILQRMLFFGKFVFNKAVPIQHYFAHTMQWIFCFWLAIVYSVLYKLHYGFPPRPEL